MVQTAISEGKKGTVDVVDGMAQYHNNAKYYLNQITEGPAKDAEAWAVGKKGGVDVGSDAAQYHNNAKYYAAAAEAAGEAQAKIAE